MSIPKCLICGEETTHNTKSSMFGLVHRWGPTDHHFKLEKQTITTNGDELTDYIHEKGK